MMRLLGDSVAKCSGHQLSSGANSDTLARRDREASAYAGMHKDRKRSAITPERQSSIMLAMRKPTDPMRTTDVETG
jgi:hypothetical protein